MHRARWISALLAIAGCSPNPLPFEEVVDTRELMLAVIDPAADIYWGSVGTIMDENGTQEIAPGTTAEWAAVRHAAAIIAESGNLLLMPGRVREDERWTSFSRQLITTGRQALEAAESRDPMAVFVAGGQVYLVCSECHAAFAPDALRSSFGEAD